MSASLCWIAWNFADRPPERVPLLRVLARDVVRGLRDPDRLRGDPDPAAVERRHRDVEALALLVQQPVGVDVRVHRDRVRRRGVEPELLLAAGDTDLVGVEHERRDAARAGRVRIGAREEEECAGVLGGRDELLRAGDPPAAVLARRRGAQGAGVGSRLGLGQREGADQLAARERRHEARALLVGTEAQQRQRHGARVDGDRDADTRVAARQLLDHEHVGEEVRSGAAVLLRHADAHQPELGELAEDVAREVVLAVPLGRVRLDLGADEVARERLDLLLLGGELEVHQP